MRKSETTPPRSSVTPHTIAPLFSSSNSGEGGGDGNVDGNVDSNDWLTTVDKNSVETSPLVEVERMSTR